MRYGILSSELMDQCEMMSNWNSVTEDFLMQNFPIHRACRDGDVALLSSLLSAGDVNLYQEDDFYGWTPIHWAAYFGKVKPCLYVLSTKGYLNLSLCEKIC